MVVAKLLPRKGPERLIFPGLDIAGRPVVEEHRTEDMLERIGHADGLSSVLPAR